MKIYDISQEVFGCKVFSGDPAPKKEIVCSMENGSLYNLTVFSMCAHNGTHIDAPFHFIDSGTTVDKLPLEKAVGYAYVAECKGDLSSSDAENILCRAGCISDECAKRILIKGDATVTLEAAEVFASRGIELVGNESQTVGPESSPMAVHKILLGAGIILLEGIRLGEVSEGAYFLCAAPMSMAGSDGAPCRAVLIEF